MISVVIPVYNEEKKLEQNLAYYQTLSENAELIFVDGESSDQSRKVAGSCGKVLTAPRGRAVQMNLGARFAHRDIILFLHADNRILPESLSAIESSLSGGGFIGGCFTQRIDDPVFIFRLIEMQGNIRARFTREFYGDQAIFVKKKDFFKLSGFPEIPVMEDVVFSRKLRRLGKTVVLNDKVYVSPRRWRQKGIISTALLYSLLNTLFWLKVPFKDIKKLYGELR
jgi:rSAM/selenodomain-associated transferase 2